MNRERSSTDIREDLEMLKDDLAQLRGDLNELMKGVVATGRRRFDQARQRMQEELRDRVDQLDARKDKAVRSVQRQVEGHPLVIIGAAFGLGMVLGVLAGRNDGRSS